MTIALVVINCYLFFENHSRQILFRYITEGLPSLGSVNSGKADFVLSAIRIDYGNGVAIADANDFSPR